MISDEERRTVAVASGVLLLASLARFAWEARSDPPLLPPSPVPESLVEDTREAVAREERASTPLADGERIDPNAADAVELDRLPGVGPALAGRIVASREAEGPFRAPADLLRVSGIGPATLARLTPVLEISGSSASATGLPRAGAPPATVDLNGASAAELEALPGIGPALAHRIVEHRSRSGSFARVEDLLEVSGIGESTLATLRPLVRVGR